MDEALIVVSVVSGLFGLAAISLINHNFFKREKFKFELGNAKKINTLKLKKVERDLGMTNKASHLPSQAQSSLIDLAKRLSPEQLTGIANLLGASEQDEYESETDLEGIGGLIDFARKNPELVKGFLSKATGGGNGSNDNDEFKNPNGWI